MRQFSKKDEEKQILHAFGESAKVLMFEVEALEPPDFKFSWISGSEADVKKKVGIEITTVTNKLLKKLESAQDSIARMAQEKFNNQFTEGVNVQVEFQRVPFSHKIENLDIIADGLFRRVADIICRNPNSRFNLREEFSHGEIYERLWVTNDNDLDYWQPFGAFSVPHIDEDEFSKIVRTKESKIANYTESFDERWLLLAANFGQESSQFQFQGLKKDFSNSPFDRIFIFQSREKISIPIKGGFDKIQMVPSD